MPLPASKAVMNLSINHNNNGAEHFSVGGDSVNISAWKPSLPPS